jgi:cellulose synthase/poly-beta-1,6-N-acetylglucosamine synthase-like glycosyltransferase
MNDYLYKRRSVTAAIRRPIAPVRAHAAPVSEAYARRPVVLLQRPQAIEISRRTSRSRLEFRQYFRSPKRIPKRKMALLLPGHNEELIIVDTIRSALAAGQAIRDIFVVDDASTDEMPRLATEMLGPKNVLTVERSGKALAIKKAIAHFNIERDYEWVHVADADSLFSKDYFTIYRSKLDSKKYAVAVSFIQSMRGNWIATYRSLTYTYGQHVNRRVQSWLGMISVFPGPLTSFRTDILSKLDFDDGTIAEDFSVTLQFYRKKLGRVVFIPGAVNYTQDPQNLRDFIKQTARWQRGFFQGVKTYKIGLRTQRIDISLGFQMLQTIIFMLQVTFMLPLIIFYTHNWLSIPVAIAADFTLNSIIAIGSSVVAKRWTLLGAMPYFYFLHWVEIIVYIRAFFEIMVFGKFKAKIVGWDTEGRRYKLDKLALQGTAAK